ncbi:MAG: hypothetical protein QM608_06210 [Caulobacter sp.]
MLDRRLTLILAAAPVGLALGVAAWAAAGGPQMADERIAAVEATQPRIGRGRKPASVVAGDWAGAPPLFDAVVPPEPQVRLLGVSRSARRTAALLSIGGGPAVWITRGETRDGVTLEAVMGGAITIDTVNGPRDVRLGEATEGAIGTAGGGAATTISMAGRGPPPPASAPAGSGL